MPTFTMGFGEDSQLKMIATASSRIDDHLFDITVEVCAGKFNGRYSAYIFEEQLIHLRDGMKRIYQNLSGSLTFETSEYIVSKKPLEFEIVGNGRGQFDVVGVARHESNRLVFNLEFDQTYIPMMIDELNEIISS